MRPLTASKSGKWSIALISVVFLAVLLLWSYSPAAADGLIFTTERSVELGREVAEELEREYGTVEYSEPVERNLEALKEALASVNCRQDLEYHLGVLDSEKVNAYAAPGGFLYVTRGLLEYVENTDELAFVIGHEMGHVAARHAISRIKINMGFRLLFSLLFRDGDRVSQTMVQGVFTLFSRGYSREQELEADRLGLQYAVQVGYSEEAMLEFLRRLGAEEDNGSGFLAGILSTHPPSKERLEAAEKFLRESPPEVVRDDPVRVVEHPSYAEVVE